MLVYAWVAAFLGDRKAARWSALLFAVLPAHAFAVQRLFTTLMHVLAAGLTLAAVWLFVESLRRGGLARRAGSLAAFAAALGCHELGLSALILAPLWARRVGPPLAWRGWTRAGAAHLAVAALYVVLEGASYVGSRSIAPYTPEGYRFGLHSFVTLVRYASALVWPSAGWTPYWCAAAAPVHLYFPSVFAAMGLGLAAASCRGWGRAAPGARFLGWALQSLSISATAARSRAVLYGSLRAVDEEACRGPSMDGAAFAWPEAARFDLNPERLRRYLRALRRDRGQGRLRAIVCYNCPSCFTPS